MKRIGLIGGMSHESTAHYYSGINKLINEKLGGLSSADMLLRSVNFAVYSDMMKSGSWNLIKDMIMDEISSLANSCELIAIATNTMHKVAGDIQFDQMILPPTFVHIGDAVADKCKALGVKRVLLLGTKFTMTEDFMKNRLRDNDLEVVDKYSDEFIDRLDHIIFDELCRGIVSLESRKYILLLLKDCLEKMSSLGPPVDGIVLGCTELDMILDDYAADYLQCQLIDSTQAHIEKIVEMALDDDDLEIEIDLS